MKRIFLDTDMLTDCDDAAAMSMLHALCDRGEAELLACAVSSRHPMSAVVVDAVNHYHGRPELAVGAPKNGRGAYRPDSCFLDKVAAEFPHRLQSNDEAPDAVRVYRDVLALSPDASVTLVTIGYMTNVADLLRSKADDLSPLDGRTLVEKKVAEWVCMGGNFPVDVGKDNVNFSRDGESAVYALRNWPGLITFAGREIGHNIFVGDRLKETPPENPARRAYQLHRERFGEHWNHHTADPCAVLYAVRGTADYFDLQEGTLDLRDDCSFTFTPCQGSDRQILVQKMDRTAMGEEMEALMIAPPSRKEGTTA
ncbi:MAG TPA: nucleoside hydrolase [Clostridia bacterium]|nr:nucleoside hydrolase [Clostridia bacterium]